MAEEKSSYEDRRTLSVNDFRVLQLVESNERLVTAIDKQNRILFGDGGDPSTGLVSRVQKLEDNSTNTWTWRRSVDRRFLFSLVFQVANFVLLGIMAGMFIWAMLSNLMRGSP